VKKQTWLIICFLLAVSVAGLWLIFSESEPEQSDLALLSVPSQDNSPSIPLAQPKVIKKKAVLDSDEEEEFNLYENEALKAQFKQVAEIYAENIKYPITSQPIYNVDDARDFKEFEQAEVDLPFPDGDDDENRSCTNKWCPRRYFC